MTHSELLFVDSAITDIETLLGGLRPGVEAVLLDAARPAPAQMARALAGRSGLGAIHVVAHGAPGRIAFAGGDLSAPEIDAAADDLAAIGRALRPGGDLRLWSCHVGAGAEGTEFVASLAHAAGTKVAAADGLVGAAALGGAWTLDDAAARAPLTGRGVAAYAGVMIIAFWTGGSQFILPSIGSGVFLGLWSNGGALIGPPGVLDIAILPDSTTPYTVSLIGNVVIGQLQIASAAGTLAIGAFDYAPSAVLSPGAIVTGGLVSIAGGTVEGGVPTNLASGGRISGFGTINASIVAGSGGGTVTASGGTLLLNGFSDVPTGIAVAIDKATASTLELASTVAQSAAFNLSNNNQTVKIDASGSLGLGATQAISGGLINMAGGTLTNTSSYTMSGGAISGFGNIAGNFTYVSGTTPVTAQGGVLTLSGNFTAMPLTIGLTAGSDLSIQGTGSSPALTMGDPHQTLDIGPSGKLTISQAQTTDTKIRLAGGTLADASGLTITTHGTVFGSGLVNANVTGVGTITASNGTLELTGTYPTGMVFAFDPSFDSTLKLDSSGTINTNLHTDSVHMTLDLGASSTLTLASAQTFKGAVLRMEGGSLATGNFLTFSGSGRLFGSGQVSGGITGTGTITGSAGQLALKTAVPAGMVIAVDTLDHSEVALFADATSTNAITLNNAFQRLTVGSTATLTIGAAQSVTNATINMAGGILSDPSGIALTSGLLFGSGLVTGILTGAGTVQANGGVLDLASPVASGLFLTIANVANSNLKLDSTVSASHPIAMSSANQTLEIGAAGTLTMGGPESITGGTIQVDGGSFVVPAGLALSGAAALLIGSGTVTGNITGAGTILASGARFSLAGTVASGLALAVDTLAGSELAILGSAVSASPITLNNANQKLSIGAAGVLTIAGVETVANATVAMAGGTLNAPGGIVLTSGQIFGSGTVLGGFASGAGTIQASGGVLDIAGALPTSVILAIDTIPNSVLKLEAKLAVGAPIGLSNSNQMLEIGAGAQVTINGVQPVSSATIQVDGGSLAVASGLTMAAGKVVGSGALTANITGTGTGTIQASGGRLLVTGSIASGMSLAVNTLAGSDLALAGTASAAGAIVLNNANQHITLMPSASLDIGASQVVSNATIALNASTLSDASGIVMASGTLLGRGAVNANLTGGGTIFASQGTLDILGTVASGLVFGLDTVSASTLQIDNTAIAATAIGLSNANQLLRIGTAGALTINAPQAVTGTTIQMQGGILNATAGLTLAAGAQLNMTASSSLGTSAVTLSGGARINAAGGAIGTGQISFVGADTVVAGGASAPTSRFGIMGLTDTIELTGITAAGATAPSISGAHQIVFPVAGGGSATINVDTTAAAGNAGYFVTPDDNGNTWITGIGKQIAGAVSVRGAGGVVQSIPFDNAAAVALAQSAANPVSAAVKGGATFSYNVPQGGGGTVPTVPGGKAGQLYLQVGSFVVLNPGYSSLFDAAPDVATVLGGASNGQVIVTGQGGVLYTASSGAGSVFAGGGNNQFAMPTGAGDQTLYAGAGNDTVLMVGGNDFIDAGTGSNLILNGQGNDTINTNGTDLIAANGAGNVTITAGTNNPTAFFGAGSTVFNAGTGKATVVSFNSPGLPGFGFASVNSAGGSQIWLGSNKDLVNSTGADTIIGATGSATVNATAGNAFVFSGTGTLNFNAGSGASTVLGNAAGTATIHGGAGSMLDLSYGPTRYFGGTGSDTVVAFGGSITAIGGAGNTIFQGGPGGANSITGGTGRSTILGGGAGDVLTAGTGPGDKIQAGSGATTITAVGSSGVNNIYAGAGADLIKTGDFNTSVQLSTGAATIVAGAGIDLYAFVNGNANTVVVQNFSAARDYLHLTGFSGTEMATALAGASTTAGTETLVLSDGTHITLQGFTGLTSANFL